MPRSVLAETVVSEQYERSELRGTTCWRQEPYAARTTLWFMNNGQLSRCSMKTAQRYEMMQVRYGDQQRNSIA
jgi:hypothetical protein